MATKGLRNFEKRNQIIQDFYKKWKKDWLAAHPGQKEPRVYNYSLRNYIYITKLSKRETTYQATWRVMSTNMVKNHFDEILKYAIKVDEVKPKANKNQSGFSKLIIMERKIKGVGTAKLTVGVRICDGNNEQYCITAI